LPKTLPKGKKLGDKPYGKDKREKKVAEVPS
jgi:hypothetical protein